jgi:hypothetical protein
MNNYQHLSKEIKLELERIFKKYCEDDLEGLGGEDEFINMMFTFVKFRLHVSGGDKSSMGSVSMESVSGFIDNISLFDDMMDDWGGAYRGDFYWERLEYLGELLNKSNLEENLKIEILQNYREINNRDEDEDFNYYITKCSS